MKNEKTNTSKSIKEVIENETQTHNKKRKYHRPCYKAETNQLKRDCDYYKSLAETYKTQYEDLYTRYEKLSNKRIFGLIKIKSLFNI